jgi:asparagine synthetase B (glutamine-hydrolysing)
MTAVDVLGRLDRNLAWDGRRIYQDADFQVGTPVPAQLRGAAACVQRDGEAGWRLLRDPLGLNKLFWSRRADGTIAVAARPRRLIEDGSPLERIQAIPRGAVVDLYSSGQEPAEHSILPAAWPSPDQPHSAGIATVANEIRATLDGYLAILASAYPKARVFVCLSGGLDSSSIAALAVQHFPELVAVSFDLRRRHGGPSEDRSTAERLAQDLGIPLLDATVTEQELLEPLDTVLTEGIDWRDFNVHAALVNAALAAAIDRAVADQDRAGPVLVLTGDLANEFLVDYQAEQYRGVTYYALPRLSAPALRASLVRGLDSCHREVGVFAAWDLTVVQPYALAVDAYLRLDANFLGLEDRKQQLCQAVVGSLLPDYIYARTKARAQVGGADGDGGVLGACVDRGIDGAWLRRRFAELHDVGDPRTLNRFVRAGCYRSAVPSLTGDALAT